MRATDIKKAARTIVETCTENVLFTREHIQFLIDIIGKELAQREWVIHEYPSWIAQPMELSALTESSLTRTQFRRHQTSLWRFARERATPRQHNVWINWVTRILRKARALDSNPESLLKSQWTTIATLSQDCEERKQLLQDLLQAYETLEYKYDLLREQMQGISPRVSKMPRRLL